jgi:hypothetical protein
MMGLFLIPLLCLPGRVFSAYCYVPFTGLAIALAGMAETAKPAVVAVLLLLWMSLNIYEMSGRRDGAREHDEDARRWITTLDRFAKTKPAVTGFVYLGMPREFHLFGVEAAVKYFFPPITAEVEAANSPEGEELLRSGRVAVLNWDVGRRRLAIQAGGAGGPDWGR